MAARKLRRDARGRFISAETARRSRAAKHAWKIRKQTPARPAPKPRSVREHTRSIVVRKPATKKSKREIEKEKRSAAARKGWETRRRNAEKKKRKRGGGPPIPTLKEYVLAVRYRSPRGSTHHGTFQAHVFAPEGTPKKDLKEAAIDYLLRRRPRYSVRAIEWKSRHSDW